MGVIKQALPKFDHATGEPQNEVNKHVQWNPSIMDTLGTRNFVRHNEVSLSQGIPVYFR